MQQRLQQILLALPLLVAVSDGWQLFECLGGCSGHGDCGLDGRCMCHPLWVGEDCNFFLAPMHGAQAFVQFDACIDGCSAPHGKCNAGVCECEPGWTGPACREEVSCPGGCGEGTCVAGKCNCPKGRFGPSCADHRCPNDCTGHGSCMAGACLCKDGWRGLRCDIEVAVQKKDAKRRVQRALLRAHNNADQLPGHEFTGERPKKSALQSPSEKPKPKPKPATSLLAWEVRNVSYAHLPADGPDLFGDEDAVSQTTTEMPVERIEGPGASASTFLHCGLSCSGHGKCNDATGTCECVDGWYGSTCDMKKCPDDCSSNGVCISGHCLCGPGFFGESCQHQRCPDDCSGHGYCFGGRCQCTGNWGGPSCEERAHSGTMIAFKLPKKLPALKGFTKATHSSVRTGSNGRCEGNCNGHGDCKLGLNGWGCQCHDGYSGPDCSDFCPDACHGNGDCIHGSCLCIAGFAGASCATPTCCSGHGSCSHGDGTCVCDEGWVGEECSLEQTCLDPLCSGHGVCTRGTCFCGPGYTGPTCADQNKVSVVDVFKATIPKCPNECSGHGTCMTGWCSCKAGYNGTDCSSGPWPLDGGGITVAKQSVGLLDMSGSSVPVAGGGAPRTADWIPVLGVPGRATPASRESDHDSDELISLLELAKNRHKRW
eukprot:gnl/TRDRNA2_/TRDRNA2_38477_c0_seq1.p1 gnl/TRDRNA2_/TRDRNA2_38477_c0~~gnl/TRDRNA2_/TRDRNA2_38477_c0_seq1.p1  ORF type:complete len:654 (+),score=85.98 gnl/TRDRNA2_/TRDRNA2_38477_c0_seq1:108-2069(+)